MKLDDLLKASGLTQTQLADKLGCRQPSISKWKRRGIPLSRILELERVTGIPRSKLAPELFEKA